MNNIALSFIISGLAGLSTMIGSIFAFIKVKNISNMINMALSFASGVMLTVSISDLLPESFNSLIKEYYFFPTLLIMILFFIVGICLSMIINKYIPSDINKDDTKLYKLGIISMIAIILHNVPEGIATFMASTKDAKLGISLAVAISLHNIPEGISIAVPLYVSTKNKLKTVFYTFVSGISELVGAIITYLFLFNFVTDVMMGLLLSLIAGIMTYISLMELLPYTMSLNNKKRSYLGFAIGILFMLVCHFIF